MIRKPVHLYFSLAPLPIDVDTRQLEGVREFTKAMQERGLNGEYHNAGELFAEVWRVIAHDLGRLNLTTISAAVEASADPVSFCVQNRSVGRDHFIDITNRSKTTDAKIVLTAQEGSWAGHVLPSWNGPTTIHAEQKRSVQVLYSLGHRQGQPAIRISWESDGEPRSKVYFMD